ncbi:MAG: hypothetical protein HY753_02900 [Nitrospirae bacterium]|nr:hypothetical protein [Nitrospirota bacterium]
MIFLHIKMLIILAVSPCITVVVHMLLTRLLRAEPAQKIAMQACVFGYFPVLLLLWHNVFLHFSTPNDVLMAVVYSFIVYAGFAYTYFHFFNMSETARRIRILYEIYKAAALSTHQILELYNTSAIITLRLKRLTETGQLSYIDGCYSIRGKTLYCAAAIVAFWRRMLGLEYKPVNKGCAV